MLNEPFYEGKVFPVLFLSSMLGFTFIFLVYGEIRNKFISIEVNKVGVLRKSFLGLSSKYYKFEEIDGWKISHLTSRGGTYEYLYFYLKNNDKKVIKISEFYHRNYFQVKENISKSYKCLGYEQFSFIDEIKEIFT